jgi:hypothetical protein
MSSMDPETIATLAVIAAAGSQSTFQSLKLFL